MKKLILLILIGALLLTGTALAEFNKMDGDFTIRGGVMFGMTPDEVKGIESGTPSESEERDCFELGYGGLDSLAGIPIYRAASDNIEYKFSLNDRKLYAIEYWYGYYDGGADEYFTELCSTITKKYGEPLHYNDGKTFSVTTPTLKSWMGYVGMGLYSLRQLSEWVVEYNNYYIMIDVFTLRDKGTDQLIVGYKMISKEEMAEIITEAITNEQEKESQRNNDV